MHLRIALRLYGQRRPEEQRQPAQERAAVRQPPAPEKSTRSGTRLRALRAEWTSTYASESSHCAKR
jgi:hypothetical protein